VGVWNGKARYWEKSSFCIPDRQRETLVTRLVRNEGENGITKAKLPGYLDEFNWSKLHQEAFGD